MKQSIETKTAFWMEVVARINSMIEQGVTPTDEEETMEIHEMDMEAVSHQWINSDMTEEDDRMFEEWEEFMDGVFEVIIAI